MRAGWQPARRGVARHACSTRRAARRCLVSCTGAKMPRRLCGPRGRLRPRRTVGRPAAATVHPRARGRDGGR
ncbi:MAG: hypothetical protein MZW92_60885 [Comamonadaceae bacterium]|nr:hypothetical protein [Comamonadaceae bacterium]